MTVRRITLIPTVMALVTAITLSSCAVNPATGRRQLSLMSEAQEIQLGQEMDPQIRREMGMYDDQALQTYVEGVAMPLARNSERPELPWSFAVVDVAAVNAFAVPGGFIYLTRGILAHLNDESELAGVLGHEIAHVTARHSAAQYSKATGASLGLLLGQIFVPELRPFGQLAETGLGVMFLRFSRDAELEADRLGAGYAAANGWDPQGVPSLLETLGRLSEGTDRKGVPNWLSTHPMPEDRVERIAETVQTLKAGADAQFRVRRAEYLQRIDGMIYGDNPAEGIVRGDSFLHPDLRFAMEFPPQWTVQNSPTQVVARAPDGNAVVFLQLVEQPQGRNLEQIAANDMRQSGLRIVEGGQTTINGLDAYVGTFQGRMQNVGDVVLRVAWIAHGRRVFRIAGMAPAQGYRQVEAPIGASLRSFRPLQENEARDIRPNVVALHTVRRGDTWQGIASGPGANIVTPATLAVLNGFSPNEQPREGDRIKIVREEGR
jgi:predicted Zn-dependent protease